MALAPFYMQPGFWATAGSTFGKVASGLGSLASGFGFGSDDGPGLTEQRNHARISAKEISEAQAYHSVEGRVNAARANGLHPLSVMGVPTSGEVVPLTYGKHGPDLAAMGQGIDRALNAGRNGLQRKLDELELERAKLSNDYLRVQIAGSQKALLGNSAGAVPSMGLTHGSGTSSNSGASLNDVLKSWKSDRLGIDDGQAPRHKLIVNDDGTGTRVLNTDVVGDNEIMMLYDFLLTTLPDDIKHAAGRDIRNFLRFKKRGAYKVPRRSHGFIKVGKPNWRNLIPSDSPFHYPPDQRHKFYARK